MYLTRLKLDRHHPKARRDLADPYEMHRTLVRVFVENEHQTPPRFLWRLENSPQWNRPTLLVQSEYIADWSHLEILDGYLQGSTDTKSIALDRLLKTDACYRFRLLANPTVTRDGKQHGLIGEDAQLSWLQRQGERFGFLLQSAMVSASDMLKARKGTMSINLRRVYYEGRFQACDTRLLAQALVSGIGPGKALGCGLLSLARC